MMYKVFFLMFLFAPFLSVSQSASNKIYYFDYLLEYSYQSKDTEKVEEKFILTNSGKSNYYLLVSESDSINYELEFKDHNRLVSSFKLTKRDFNSKETINLNCDLLNRFENPYKYQVKNYAFLELSDTIIAGNRNDYYKLKRIGKIRKKRHRNKIREVHYIIKDSTNFHSPILLHSTAFEESKKEKNIPNGIFRIKYFKSSKGIKEDVYRLKNIINSERRIIINTNCSSFKNGRTKWYIN